MTDIDPAPAAPALNPWAPAHPPQRAWHWWGFMLDANAGFAGIRLREGGSAIGANGWTFSGMRVAATFGGAASSSLRPPHFAGFC